MLFLLRTSVIQASLMTLGLASVRRCGSLLLDYRVEGIKSEGIKKMEVGCNNFAFSIL